MICVLQHIQTHVNVCVCLAVCYSVYMYMYYDLCITVDGQWGEWGSWGRCINGERRIERKCDNPEPANHGAGCVGYAEARQRC